MPGRRHDALVEALTKRRPSIQTKGFKEALRKLLFDDWGFERDESLAGIRLIPDAYEVEHDLVICWEVEDSHRVSDSKMLDYARLWYGLRDLEIEFRLVIMDIRGGVMEPDLWRWWYGIR